MKAESLDSDTPLSPQGVKVEQDISDVVDAYEDYESAYCSGRTRSSSLPTPDSPTRQQLLPTAAEPPKGAFNTKKKTVKKASFR